MDLEIGQTPACDKGTATTPPSTTPPPPPSPPADTTSSTSGTWGFRYWAKEISTAKEHGGDYQTRFDGAIRAALGSLTIFSVVVFPPNALEMLDVVWLGNIFMHVCIKDSLGSSLRMVLRFGQSLVLTTCIAWPLNIMVQILRNHNENAALAIFPFLEFLTAFGIMSCPQLVARNAMVVIMHIMVGNAVLGAADHWGQPLFWMLVMVIGICIAPIVNLLPNPRLALRSAEHLLSELQSDLALFLTRCKVHHGEDTTTEEFAVSPETAKASILFLYSRIVQTTKDLEDKLPSVKIETMFCASSRNTQEQMQQWVKRTRRLQPQLQCLQNALAKPFVSSQIISNGTVFTYGETIQNATTKAQNRALNAMIDTLAAFAWPRNNPKLPGAVLVELEESIQECHIVFRRVMTFASTNNNTLLRGDSDRTQVFARMTSQMAAFHALLELGDSLVLSFQEQSLDEEELDKEPLKPVPFWRRQMATLTEWISQPWLWWEKETFRLAIKTGVGMAIASLFVSVPYLKEMASPHELWPGNTIASVNLATTGSSFHKAGDRMYGTLLAAAYALLVADLIPGNPETLDWVKIPAIVVFTFVMIYLKDNDHAYLYSYAANSIGSMLYGSVDVGYDLEGYVPKRIELIVVGIIIFTAVELLIFVRSSREIVETKALSVFQSVLGFIDQVYLSTVEIERHAAGHDTNSISKEDGDEEDPFLLKKLSGSLAALKAEATEFKKELKPGLQEPLMGFSLPLHPASFWQLAAEHEEYAVYGTLLVKNMEEIAQKLQSGHQLELTVQWSHLQRLLVSEELQKMKQFCQQLHAAFPDGRLRPQISNAVRCKAIVVAGSLRGFGGDSLGTFTKWSDICTDIMKETGLQSGDIGEVLTLATTTGYFLKFCLHIEKTGVHLEAIAHKFPRSQSLKKD